MYIFYPRVGERFLFAISFLFIMLMPVISWIISAEALYMIASIMVSALAWPFGISYIMMFFSQKPGLVIDDKGVTVNMCQLFWRNHFFPWSIIGGVRVRTDQLHLNGFTFHRVLLYIYPKHPKTLFSRPEHKWFRWRHLELPCSYRFIQKGLDANAICAAIKANGKLRK